MIKKINVSTSIIDEDINGDSAFTGSLYKFTSCDLTYLLLEIEKEYSIRLSIKQLSSYGMNNIKNLAKSIQILLYDKERPTIIKEVNTMKEIKKVENTSGQTVEAYMINSANACCGCEIDCDPYDATVMWSWWPSIRDSNMVASY